MVRFCYSGWFVVERVLGVYDFGVEGYRFFLRRFGVGVLDVFFGFEDIEEWYCKENVL